MILSIPFMRFHKVIHLTLKYDGKIAPSRVAIFNILRAKNLKVLCIKYTRTKVALVYYWYHCPRAPPCKPPSFSFIALQSIYEYDYLKVL